MSGRTWQPRCRNVRESPSRSLFERDFSIHCDRRSPIELWLYECTIKVYFCKACIIRVQNTKYTQDDMPARRFELRKNTGYRVHMYGYHESWGYLQLYNTVRSVAIHIMPRWLSCTPIQVYNIALCSVKLNVECYHAELVTYSSA